MIVNNVLLKLNDRDKINQTKNILLRMKNEIKYLLTIQVELNTRSGEDDYDLLFITTFKTHEEMEKYLSHPKHIEAAEFISSVLDSQASVCYET
ncbi:Dabb family protein [Jeotgalibacillus sp. ET6]|uniref:Dabb family protein n=1 Tax=Jeotgalibacillus sp. ET6 TaxID=3037260 RepID=UPI002418B095|nr:Dabb family protein [Jeotgalibacillus sp. ET6]MDG5473123.1 Dabb family protein [Jeotgalibacillus sp. ET6]